MSDLLRQGVLPPDPPREVPKWFFVRRMQSLLFMALFLPGLGVALGVGLAGMLVVRGYPVLPFADWSLDAQHETSLARITDVRVMKDFRSNGAHPWRVAFALTLPVGQTVHAVGYTWDQSFAGRTPGDAIEVQYDPADPRRARPTGGYVAIISPATSLLLATAFLPELALGLVLLVYLVGKARAERKLLTYGLGAEAEVIQIRRIDRIHFGSKSPFDVYYRFVDYQRCEAVGKDRTYRYAWAEGLKPGDKVGVVYNPVESSVNALWLHGTKEGER